MKNNNRPPVKRVLVTCQWCKRGLYRTKRRDTGFKNVPHHLQLLKDGRYGDKCRGGGFPSLEFYQGGRT